MKKSKTLRKVKVLIEAQRRLQMAPCAHFHGRFLEWERKPTGHPFRQQFLVFECPLNAFHRKNPLLRVSLSEILKATALPPFLP